ncbi:MAG: ArsC/Spx/MgsR family protein [Pseudomonadota bacterium]|nr:ArsC/Spx/MgsR family protein [Pseudomonadota bacterium]
MRERDVEFDVIEYLKTPLSREDLERIVDLVPESPEEMVRKDKNFSELGLNADDYKSKDTVVEILLEHPKLMQRPVMIRGEQAVIGRPSEKVLALLE